MLGIKSHPFEVCALSLKKSAWISLQEGCEGTENRLILHILTRPLCLFILAVFSSILRCLVHSFILALAIPVFLLIVFLKITMPRSTGVLGSSRPYWDYVGSSYREAQDDTLQNPYCRISGKTPFTKKVSLLTWWKFTFFFSSFYLRLVAKYYFCSAKAPSWIQRQGQRDVNRKDHSREGAGSRAGLAGRVWRRYPGLHLPGGRDTSRHQQDLQAGDRLLVPQGGPRSAACPKPGAEREGDRGTQSVCTRPLPLKVGGSLLQETGLSPAWGGN